MPNPEGSGASKIGRPVRLACVCPKPAPLTPPLTAPLSPTAAPRRHSITHQETGRAQKSNFHADPSCGFPPRGTVRRKPGRPLHKQFYASVPTTVLRLRSTPPQQERATSLAVSHAVPPRCCCGAERRGEGRGEGRKIWAFEELGGIS
eukprot:scaffold2760_cov59-Phaeocystis_antarctica.AAC.2